MIKISADKGKFIINCPYGMNHLLNGITNKRWSSKKKCYQVPYSRKVVEELRRIPGPKDWDQLALDFAVEMTEKQLTKAETNQQKAKFPVNYMFKTTPRDCQVRALNFLWGKTEAALFMKMRTGKTKTVIDWAAALNVEEKINGVIVFCPISAKGDWEAQVHRHSPVNASVGRFDFTNKADQKKFKTFVESDHLFKFLIVGVESMSAGSAFDYAYDFVSTVGKVLCVVDESHMIKGFDKERTLKITNIGSISDYRVILTGTPITKAPLDLFSQYRFLDPDIIGYSDFYSFKSRYAIVGGYENREIVGYEHIDELLGDVAPYTFQVGADEVAELLPKEYRTLEIELPVKVRQLYNKLDNNKNKIVVHNDRQLVISNALDRMTRKIRLVNGIMSYGESGVFDHEWINDAKIRELLEFMESNPAPAIVWTTGKLELENVVKALRSMNLKCSILNGGMKDQDRTENIAKFQNGDVDCFVSNISAGCSGINLSRAEMMIYMSNSFKYVDREQSEERATDFSNTEKSILIVDIIAKDTVDDEVILPAIKAKKDVADFIDDSIREIKASEIVKLFDEIDLSDI